MGENICKPGINPDKGLILGEKMVLRRINIRILLHNKTNLRAREINNAGEALLLQNIP